VRSSAAGDGVAGHGVDEMGAVLEFHVVGKLPLPTKEVKEV